MERGTLNESLAELIVQNIRMGVPIFKTGASRSTETGKGTLKFFKQEGLIQIKRYQRMFFINKYLFISKFYFCIFAYFYNIKRYRKGYPSSRFEIIIVTCHLLAEVPLNATSRLN